MVHISYCSRVHSILVHYDTYQVISTGVASFLRGGGGSDFAKGYEKEGLRVEITYDRYVLFFSSLFNFSLGNPTVCQQQTWVPQSKYHYAAKKNRERSRVTFKRDIS